MKVHILNPKEIITRPEEVAHASYAYNQFMLDAAADKKRNHVLCSSINEADVCLAPISFHGYGRFFEILRRSSIYRNAHCPIVVYSAADAVVPTAIGLYPSVTRRWRETGLGEAAHYRSLHPNMPVLSFRSEDLVTKDLLVSFVGSVWAHPVRAEICQLSIRDSIIKEASPDVRPWWERHEQAVSPLINSYRDVLRRSQFVLCPRGASQSSVRIFEAMQALAVPIMISNGIELPTGPDWSECSIMLRLDQVKELPAILEHHQSRAVDMGRRAQTAWETYFAPETSFDSMINWSSQLLSRSSQARRGVMRGLAVGASFVVPRNLRARLAPRKKKLMEVVRRLRGRGKE